MSIITTLNHEYDFWELYPELASIEEFKYIKDNYKKNSSKVMWFIVYCFDIGPDNKFKNLEFDERTRILSKDIVKDKDFWINNNTKLDNTIAMYIKMNDTAAKRHLRQWLDTLEKRTVFLKNTEYSLENFEKIDKMATNSKAIFETFELINKMMQKEEGTSITKGGYLPSLSDNDEI